MRNRRLAPRFSAYEEHERGPIDADGRKLRRVVYRWNGRFYSEVNDAPSLPLRGVTYFFPSAALLAPAVFA